MVFWKLRKEKKNDSTETKTTSVSTSVKREKKNVKISVFEGISNQVAIQVSAWDKDDAFELFQKVRREVKEGR